MALNYPVGETVEEALELSKIDPKEFVGRLLSSSFAGYMVVTIEGFSGIEEGVLFFRDNLLVGAAFSYDHYDLGVFGDVALESFFNALASKRGIVDVYRLTKQQLDLILALDERTAVARPIGKEGIDKKLRAKYDSFFGRQALQGMQKVVRPASDLIKKIGLGDIAK